VTCQGDIAVRHLGSIVLSLLLGVSVYLLTGVALSYSARFAADEAAPERFAGLLAAVVAGLLYSVLVLARLSPFGPVLVGLLFAGLTAWAWTDAPSFVDTMPATLFGVSGVTTLPAVPFSALLAVPLLLIIASPRRWRRRATPPPRPAAAPPGAVPPAAVSPAAVSPGGSPYAGPSYDTPPYNAPSYGGPQHRGSIYGAPPSSSAAPGGFPYDARATYPPAPGDDPTLTDTGTTQRL
jgi:hypothetical protein